jgi:hypothetical protein
MTIDVQSSEKEGTKDYEGVKQAIELARRPEGVWRSELTKITGMDLSRWGTRMCHHPDWKKGHKLISTQHTNGQWHFQIVLI